MNSIYLLSGSRKQEFPGDIMDELRKEVKDDYVFCFVAGNFEEIERNKIRCNKILEMFKEKGIIFNSYFIIDNSIDNETAQNYIEKSNVIFLMGGNPIVQMKHIKEKQILTNLKRSEAIIIGMSAGSMNMAENVVITKDVDDDIPETMCYEGIGLTDINLEPHCDFDNSTHWNDLLEASKISQIICMEDTCSILIRNNEKRIFGKYSIIDNGEIVFTNR